MLKTREVADMLGIKPNTMERWRMTGNGPRFLKIGGKVLYRQQDIDNFIEENVRQSTSDRAA